MFILTNAVYRDKHTKDYLDNQEVSKDFLDKLSRDGQTAAILQRTAEILDIKAGEWGWEKRLALALGIIPQSLSDWKKRDAPQIGVILTAISRVNGSPNYVLKGVGPKFLNDPAQMSTEEKMLTFGDGGIPIPEGAKLVRDATLEELADYIAEKLRKEK